MILMDREKILAVGASSRKRNFIGLFVYDI